MSSLSRRTAAKTTRLNITLGDLFTACYSATLATAAVLDSNYKQKRRDMWDQAIREVKGEDQATGGEEAKRAVEWALRQTMEDGHGLAGEERKRRDVQALQKDAIEKEQETVDKAAEKRTKGDTVIVRNVTVRTVTMSAPRSRQAAELDKVASPTREAKNCNPPPPDYEVSMQEALDLLTHYVNNVISEREKIGDPRGGGSYILKETVTSEETGDRFHYFSTLPERKPKTAAHLVAHQNSILRMINRLLTAWESSKPIQSETETPESKESKAKMAATLASLSDAGWELPSYGLGLSEEAESVLGEMNRSILAVLKEPNATPDLIVAKICYNLLVSYVPPNIVTFNILLMHFTKLGFGDLAEVIVESFLYDTRLKPNEGTISAILAHYIARYDVSGFNSFIQRMRGTAGDVRIKRRHIYDLYHFRVSSWARNTKVIHRNGFLIQKAPRDHATFYQLLVGTLTFGKMRRAIMFTRAMIREGYALTPSMLHALVNSCITRSDLKNARALLHTIAVTWFCGEASNDDDRRVDISPTNRHFVHKLMSFCGIHVSSTFEIKDLLAAGWSYKRWGYSWEEPVIHLARALQMDIIMEDLKRRQGRIAGVQLRILGEKQPSQAAVLGQLPRTLLKRLRSASEFLDRRLEYEADKAEKILENERIGSMLREKGAGAETDLLARADGRLECGAGEAERRLEYEADKAEKRLESEWTGAMLPEKGAGAEIDLDLLARADGRGFYTLWPTDTLQLAIIPTPVPPNAETKTDPDQTRATQSKGEQASESDAPNEITNTKSPSDFSPQVHVHLMLPPPKSLPPRPSLAPPKPLSRSVAAA